MKNIQENIKKILEPLMIYDLTPNNKTDQEIKVYAISLQKINDKIDDILKEGIIQTAEKDGLKFKEELMLEKADDTESYEVRRNKIINLLKMDEKKFSKEDIKEYIRALGINCEIKEDIKNEKVTVKSKEKIKTNLNIYKEKILKMMPVHLDIDIDIGNDLTWEDLDNITIGSMEQITLE